MIALSPGWSWLIVGGVALVVIVLALALAGAASRADDYMDRRWVERRWAEELRKGER